MAKQDKIKNKSLLDLCDFDKKRNVYLSKSGQKYITALYNHFKGQNKNDKPFTINDIKKQPTVKQFKFKGVKDFKFICNLKAEPLQIKKDANYTRKNEKIIPNNFININAENIFKNEIGIAYMITTTIGNKEHIIKFGETRKTMKDRLGSYNCGTVNNWRTASTTNIKILQSFVATRLQYNLYICTNPKAPITIIYHGIKSIPIAYPYAIAVEDITIKEFIKQFKHKPLANIQADAKTKDYYEDED